MKAGPLAAVAVSNTQAGAVTGGVVWIAWSSVLHGTNVAPTRRRWARIGACQSTEDHQITVLVVVVVVVLFSCSDQEKQAAREHQGGETGSVRVNGCNRQRTERPPERRMVAYGKRHSGASRERMDDACATSEAVGAASRGRARPPATPRGPPAPTPAAAASTKPRTSPLNITQHPSPPTPSPSASTIASAVAGRQHQHQR